MFGIFYTAINVKAISKGRKLHKAIEKDSNFYIQCRSTNKLRKVNVGLWLILYEDNHWIYWGYPKFRWFFSQNRYVDILYKTNKKKLLDVFPDFRKDF